MIMRVTQAIEDFFRGARLIVGGLLAVGIVLLSGILLVSGVLFAFTYNAPAYIGTALVLVTVLIGVPVALLRIGRYARRLG
jgi:hypothetical protein